MEFQTSSKVLGMFISHWDDHALPGVIASTLITPFVYTEFYIHTTQTDNQWQCVQLILNVRLSTNTTKDEQNSLSVSRLGVGMSDIEKNKIKLNVI